MPVVKLRFTSAKQSLRTRCVYINLCAEVLSTLTFLYASVMIFPIKQILV